MCYRTAASLAYPKRTLSANVVDQVAIDVLVESQTLMAAKDAAEESPGAFHFGSIRLEQNLLNVSSEAILSLNSSSV